MHAFAGDALGTAGGRRYDLILSNPPFHSGREVDYQIAEAFIRQSRLALQPGGRLIIVVNRFLRYERWLEGLFARISESGGNKRFRVLTAEV